ncbi:hypothetical protein SAMN04487904_115110 [Actinopolyspora lacussalsi subsp. righensis]|uniref:Uncharacterized protein n=1 Tax=Actinopolyspora righensis TaxID=995060 RepID=A0A1I7C8N4_9ACTN|nr:hypothetical protein [Actinopolyspora righensis]SFT95762.1 hypothetical protein SAMN04487904_115110 [Actinopolyspora righensis]
MDSKRPFRPGFICTTGSCFVAIDQVQPVAISLSPAGEVLDVTSWADQVSPAVTKKRTIASGKDCVFVCDWPPSLSASSGMRTPFATVVIAVAPSGQLSASVSECTEIPPQSRRDRYLKDPKDTYTIEDIHIIEEIQQNWVFRIHLIGKNWHSEVLYETERIDFPAPAHITSQAVLGNVAAMCVQRANKRPWTFRPKCDIQLATATEYGLTSTQISSIDIGHLCWPRERNGTAVRRELGQYLDFACGSLYAAISKGAYDPQIVVHGIGLDTVIELWFKLDVFPGIDFCRQDIPFDETGNIAGLRAYTIMLDEDIEFSILQGDFDTSGSVAYV